MHNPGHYGLFCFKKSTGSQNPGYLACLTAIGHTRFNSLLRSHGRSTNALKQDIGLFVPVLLVAIFGPENVETYRNTETRTASTRSNTWRELDWVSRYTPHRILRMIR